MTILFYPAGHDNSTNDIEEVSDELLNTKIMHEITQISVPLREFQSRT